jgi:hypothetical protein
MISAGLKDLDLFSIKVATKNAGNGERTKKPMKDRPRNPYRRGRLSTVDLLVPTSLDHMLLILRTLFTFYKTSYLNEEVKCTEHSL